MKVLLISPVRDLDPPCGDITFTETLLSDPPDGVEYETYERAIKRGALKELRGIEGLRQAPFLLGFNKIINVLRGKRWLYWEPPRFLSIRPGEFDLVHMHVFSARFLHLDCPLIVSSGAPQCDLYHDRRAFSKARVALMDRADYFVEHALRINCASHKMPQASKVLVYTEYYKKYLIEHGYCNAETVDVVPIFLRSPASEVKPSLRVHHRIGFVANNFEEKGGDILLKAFSRIVEIHPDAQLWIVGGQPSLTPELKNDTRINCLGRVPREELLEEIMPSFDVFAYPTPHDCFSYVMLEAMARGVAIATSDYISMPEAVNFGQAGLTSPVGDAEALADNILRLFTPEFNGRFRLAARERFEQHFSWDVVAPRLLHAYESAINDHVKSTPE